MQPQHRLRPVQRARADKLDCAAGRKLLRVLKDQPRLAGEALAVFAQKPRERKQHRGVPVVPAGMHYARVTGAIRQIVFLLHRQRVDIRAKRDGGAAAGLFAHDMRNQPRLRRSVDRVHAEAAQKRLQILRRLRLFKRHLRVLVHVPAPCDQIRLDCAYFGVKHRFFSSLFH